jgi:hypothetical protein
MFFSQEEITPYRKSTPPAVICVYHNTNACSSQEVRTFGACAKTSMKNGLNWWTIMLRKVDSGATRQPAVAAGRVYFFVLMRVYHR